MPLASGARLGPYQIAAQIGAGGMGDVYRARDTRLDRVVALKVSKEEFTPRFETEARATAALEHPHICRLYDVCHENGVSFLVMEYVEGTPLGGPLPLERVSTYAGQIAGALDEAHRKQIVHRDLKPTNILVTKSGVKLLDFGLAKLGHTDTPLDDAALTRGIAVRTLGSLATRLLQGTENVTEHVIWSPDERFIAFVADRKLKTLDLVGGSIRTVVEDVGAGAIGGGAWNADGTIIFGAFQRGLLQVSAAGGVPVQVTKPAAYEIHALPLFLPDGRRFLYVAVNVRERKAEARLATFDDPVVHRFPLEDGGRVLYAPSGPGEERGDLIFTRGTTLVAQPVSLTTLSPLGEAVVVANDVGGDSSQAPGAFSVSATGALGYLSGDVWKASQLTWFSRDGTMLNVVGPTDKYNDLSLSPDERRLAVTAGEGTTGDIWLFDLARNARGRFTTHPAQDWHPVWSPDGSRLAFSSARQAPRQNAIFWKDAANIGNEEVVSQGPANQRLNDWSPDGKLLLVAQTAGLGDLWILPVTPTAANGERKAEPYVQSTQFSETRGQFYPVLNPDGRYWIAYSSNETGQNEIYVESLPRGAARVTVSTAGGMQPRWRRDGRELFYLSLDRKLMAVDVTMGKQLDFGVPRALFQTRVSASSTDISRVLRYDVTRDGKRFLINSEPEGAEAASALITVVLNWKAALTK